MKKILFSIVCIMMCLFACTKAEDTNTTIESSINFANTEATTIIMNDNSKEEKTVADIIETITRQNKRAAFSFDPANHFIYTGDEKYLKEVTEAMLTEFGSHFEQTTNVEIPTPYIVRIDDEDKNDIKVYGDFYIYGYTINGMIFDCVNGGSFPGCIHLKEDDEKISFLSVDIAEDGSNFDSSLLKICDNDESLKKDIINERFNDGDNLRIDYVKMYANNYNLNICGIKDFGWPVILFDNISDASFVYNFYDAYFNEVLEDDVLNDFADRIDNLKNKYLTNELLSKIDNLIEETDSDPIIGAQDVTEIMLDTMKVDDYGDGNLIVSIDIDDNRIYNINCKLDIVDGNKKFIDMEFNTINTN